MEREPDPERPNRLTPEQLAKMTPEEILEAHDNKLIRFNDLNAEQLRAIGEIIHRRNCQTVAWLDDLEDEFVKALLNRSPEEKMN